MSEKIDQSAPVTDQEIEDVLSRDEAGVGALVDAYLPAELVYLEASASLSGDSGSLIITASATPLNR